MTKQLSKKTHIHRLHTPELQITSGDKKQIGKTPIAYQRVNKFITFPLNQVFDSTHSMFQTTSVTRSKYLIHSLLFYTVF